MKTSTKEVVNVDKRSHDGSTLTSMMNRRIQFPFESSVSKKNSAYKKIRSVFNGIPRTVRVHHPPEFLVVLVEDSEREADDEGVESELVRNPITLETPNDLELEVSG